MKLENVKAQMRKGVLEYCILSILSVEDAYASDIINQLKEVEMIVVEGTLYPLLTRLKNDDLLSYRWEESNQGPHASTMLLPKRAVSSLPNSTRPGTNLWMP